MRTSSLSAPLNLVQFVFKSSSLGSRAIQTRRFFLILARVEASEALRYRVGDWIADDSEDRLSRDGVEKKIQRRAMAVLSRLAITPGRVVSKHELLESVWGGVTVSDHSVAIVISDLRRDLEDDRQRPLYIETVQKRGYRLIAPVSECSEADDAAPANQRGVTRRTWLAVGVGGLALIGAAGMWAAATGAQEPPLLVMDFVNATGRPEFDHIAFGYTELTTTALATQRPSQIIRWRAEREREGALADARAALGRPVRMLRAQIVAEGDQLTLAAQLVAPDGRTVSWGSTYASQTSLHPDIAAALARDVLSAIGHAASQAIAGRDPWPASVHEAYWRARRLWALREGGSPAQACVILLELLSAHPDYAPAHATIASIYAQKTGEALGLPRAQTFREAERHLETAERLGAPASDLEVTRTFLARYRDRNDDVALVHARNAVHHNQANALAWQTLAMVLSASGHDGEAIRAADRAVALEPATYAVLWDRIWFLYIAGRPRDALSATEAAERVTPRQHFYKALIYQALGRAHEAWLSWLDRAQSRGVAPETIARLRAAAGSRPDATAYRQLLQLSQAEAAYEESGIVLAILYLNAEQNALAREAYARAPAGHDMWLAQWKHRIPALRSLAQRT